MKIGIIGTGNIGGTIARKMAAVGHEVRVANSKGVEGVRAFAEEVGAQPVDVDGAVNGVDVIILSIPLPALEALPSDLLKDVPLSVPVVDTSNYYPGLRDPHISELEAGMPESLWVSRQLGRPVVKAFNNILAYSLEKLGQPEGTPRRLAVAVAADDQEAKSVVMSLVSQAGFDPVDGGTLEESWRQQPCTPGYCCDFDAEAMKQGLASAVKGHAEAIRDALPKHFARLGASPTHADIVSMNREMNTVD